jgi:serine/threonine protein kinase
LAEGATGVVYAAISDDNNSAVAVKIYKKELIADSDASKRFQREVLALSHIIHPNIVRIISSGETASGQAFIVMELLDGVSIRTVLDTEGVFEPTRAVKVTREICRALEALHSKDIIHRDVKPSNIMLDPSNIAKIVDFGIAKFLGHTTDTITQYGSILGTPSYMSPEQCLGQKIDERSDVYSVGCTLFEMLTGVKAFEGQTAMEALAKQIDDDRIHLEKPLVAAGAPPDLRAIVFKCLSRQPDNRYNNVTELSHDLGAFQLGAPLTFARGLGQGKRASLAVNDRLEVGLQKLRPHWQLIACCFALITAAIIIRFNINTINGLAPKATTATAENKLTPSVLYDRKTRQTLYSDPKAFTVRDAVVSAVRHHVTLKNADLAEQNFGLCNLDGADFTNADLSNTIFNSASLSDASFHGANLRGSSFIQAKLTRADLSASVALNANFTQASATSANFMGADLTDADLSIASFRDANFKNANLSGARIQDSDLAGADLSYADCSQTRINRLRSPLYKTNFNGTKNLNFSNY